MISISDRSLEQGKRHPRLVRSWISQQHIGHIASYLIFLVCQLVAPQGVSAVELDYRPNLPQFGGVNGQNLTILQLERQITDSRVAKEDSLRRELDRLKNQTESTPTSLLVASLTRSLNSKIASRITDDILNGAASEQEFLLGDVVIRYVRDEEGMITVTIDDGTGETSISIPGVAANVIQ
jgi:hypothetical protein